jgi:hypothetical protein
MNKYTTFNNKRKYDMASGTSGRENYSYSEMFSGIDDLTNFLALVCGPQSYVCVRHFTLRL